jgi:hypothetical protein
MDVEAIRKRAESQRRTFGMGGSWALATILEMCAEITRLQALVEWRPGAQTPSVKPETSAEFIVAASYDGGKTFVTTCHFLNGMYLDTEDDRLLENYDEDKEGVPFSGWHWRKEHTDYDGFYEPLTKYHVILGWLPMPSFTPPTADEPKEQL